MATLRQSTIREARDPAFAILLAAIAISFVRAADQPGLDVSAGGASIKIAPGDLVMVALAAVLAVRLVRTWSYPRLAAALTVAATAFATLILLTALPNGSTAFVAAAKLVELTVLLAGCAMLVNSVERVWAVILVMLAGTTVAVIWGLFGFAKDIGGRQAAFVGEHDLAALSTFLLVVWLAALHSRHRLGRLPLAAGIIGAVGIILGAALATLIGLYLAAAALIGISALRRSLRLRAAAMTVLVVVGLTGATYFMRAGELGFLNEWFAPAKNATPGEYASSWSQRLVYAYVGGRMFIANPVLGTGWWGEVPSAEYARFLPDARARFPDQPARYFPPADGLFIPQQTFDQVAYELGIVGLALLLAVIAVAVRDSVRSASRWPRADDDEIAAFLAAPWLASLIGALAGSALFGGTPMAALTWLTFGLVAALAVLATAAARATRPSAA